MSKTDLAIKVTLQQDGFFSIPSKDVKKTNLKGIGNLIREGYKVRIEKSIEDGSKIDLTKETLIRVALFDHPGDHEKKVNAVLMSFDSAQRLSNNKELLEESMYLIIENGGLAEYAKRQAKGMIYE